MPVSVFPCLPIFGLQPQVFFCGNESAYCKFAFFQKVCLFVPKLRTEDSSFVGVFLVPLSCSWSWSHS